MVWVRVGSQVGLGRVTGQPVFVSDKKKRSSSRVFFGSGWVRKFWRVLPCLHIRLPSHKKGPISYPFFSLIYAKFVNSLTCARHDDMKLTFDYKPIFLKLVYLVFSHISQSLVTNATVLRGLCSHIQTFVFLPE